MNTEELTAKLLSGEVVKIDRETFYFSEPGNWISSDGCPVHRKLHRTDGPAIEYPDGTKEWWLNGKRHRTDGPAIEQANGAKCWYLNGKLHRTDGPAIEQADGEKYWFINGENYTELMDQQLNRQMDQKTGG